MGWWSLGVIAYTMLCGKLPFDMKLEDNFVTTKRNIELNPLTFPDSITITRPAKDFVSQLLNKEHPEARIRVNGSFVLINPWFQLNHIIYVEERVYNPGTKDKITSNAKGEEFTLKYHKMCNKCYQRSTYTRGECECMQRTSKVRKAVTANRRASTIPKPIPGRRVTMPPTKQQVKANT